MAPNGGPIPQMPAKPRKTALPGRLVGYARVSTEEQGTDPQLDELRAAGCATLLIEDGFMRGVDALALARESGIWPDFIAPRL